MVSAKYSGRSPVQGFRQTFVASRCTRMLENKIDMKHAFDHRREHAIRFEFPKTQCWHPFTHNDELPRNSPVRMQREPQRENGKFMIVHGADLRLGRDAATRNIRV